MINVELRIIRHHHERFDGTGYPEGLGAEEIPLGSRILAVADSFEALTSDRPYREAVSAQEAIEELRKCARTQLDADLVERFARIQSTVTRKPASG